MNKTHFGTFFILIMFFGCVLQAQTPQDYIFQEVSGQANIGAKHRAIWDPTGIKEGYLAMGQAWGDYDNDGWLDLYVTGNLDANVLYHNQQNGSFSISSYSSQLSLPKNKSGAAVWTDYDNDGWRDLYVLVDGNNVLYKNLEGQGFQDVTAQAGVGTPGKGAAAAWGDYDNDGWLDLYVTNWACLPECEPFRLEPSQDRLYHNKGDGSFEDVSQLLSFEKTLGSGFAASFADVDNDQDLDIYVVNDIYANVIGNVLWRNDGPGCGGWCWTDASELTQSDAYMHGMGLAIADYDSDGDLDMYASDMAGPMNLFRNTGLGFEDATSETGVGVNKEETVGWGTAFLDVDNDGWQDLMLATTGMKSHRERHYGGTAATQGMHHPHPNMLFKNFGGSFSDLSQKSWLENDKPSMGLAIADYDNDGWLDFVQGNWNDGYALYHNESGLINDNHWLTIRLVGQGYVNRDAIGARVYLTTNNGKTQMQEVKSGSSFGAGNDPRLHFGLGKASIDALWVIWPNGEKQIITSMDSDQFLTISYSP